MVDLESGHLSGVSFGTFTSPRPAVSSFDYLDSK